MIDLSIFPKSVSKSTKSEWRWLPYLLWGGLFNIAIWGATLFYLIKTPKVYSSQWAISVNGGKLNTNVNLPGIGQATSSSESSYNSLTSDPRENYKFVLSTSEVLEAAAKQANLPVSEFRKLRIKVLNNTTLIQLQIEGKSPEQAQKKAVAIQTALEARLGELRLEEIAEQDKNIQPTLEPLQQKLLAAQQRLSEYKARSPLSLTEQLNYASENLEELRRANAEAVAEFEQITARVQQLSSSLGLSVSEVADALVLQSNSLFQQYLSDYTKAATELTELNGKYTPASPIWMAKRQTRDEAYAALMKQSQALLGKSVSQTMLEQLSMNNSYAQRAGLFRELLVLEEQYRGMQANVKSLSQQIAQLEARKNVLTKERSKLDSLERDVKIADAVFSSNLTKLDLSKSINSPSYPPIAVIAKPSLPHEPSSPKKKFALLGAAMGSIFLSTGMVLLIMRDRQKQAKKLNSYRQSDNLLSNNQTNRE